MNISDKTPNTDMDEKITPGLNRPTTPDEAMKGEVVEDDGEVFKMNEGGTQFRTLGL